MEYVFFIYAPQAYAWFLAAWAKRLSCKEVAEVFHSSWEAVFGAAEMAVAWGRARGDLSGIQSLGIDEIAWQRGHRCLTAVTRSTLMANACCG